MSTLQCWAAHDVIDSWMSSSGIRVTGVSTVEKARDIVSAANLYFEAGYPGPQCMLDAEELLKVALAEASEGGNPEIIGILTTAAADVEQQFMSPGEREQKLAELQERFNVGQQLTAEGDFTDAVGRLSGILTDPFFSRNKTLTRKLRVKTEEALLVARADYEKEQAPKRLEAMLRSKALDLILPNLEKGVKSPEAESAWNEWQAAALNNTRELSAKEGEPPVIFEIRWNIKQATMLRDVGLYQETFNTLNTAQTQARKERHRDLFDAAGGMMDEINKLGNTPDFR